MNRIEDGKRGKPLGISHFLYFTPPRKAVAETSKVWKSIGKTTFFAQLPTSHESGRNQLPGDAVVPIDTLSGGG